MFSQVLSFGDHSCLDSQHNTNDVLTAREIAMLIEGATDIDLKAKGVKAAMGRSHNLNLTYMKAFRASKLALEGARGEVGSQFNLVDVILAAATDAHPLTSAFAEWEEVRE